MKRRAAQFFFLFVLGLILVSVSGCQTDESQNTSVRPWNAPQGWEGGMPMMNDQRR